MKHALWILLIWAAATVPGKTAGLIIVHEEDFWRRPWPYPNPPLIPTPPAPGPPLHRLPPPVWAPLETTLTQVGVKIKEQIAVTSIDQEFYNPNPRQLEGTFLFPVPKGAQINKFSMEINGKQVEAELLAADKARGTYEEIVRKLNETHPPRLLASAQVRRRSGELPIATRHRQILSQTDQNRQLEGGTGIEAGAQVDLFPEPQSRNQTRRPQPRHHRLRNQ